MRPGRWSGYVVALSALIATMAGCSTTKPSPKPSPSRSTGSARSVEVRPVVRMTLGACTTAALTRGGAGVACGLAGMSRYELGAPLGELTVTHAVVANEFKGVATNTPLVVVQFDAAGTMTFSAVTRANVGKQLAFLVAGKVVLAPMIQEPITDGMVELVPDPFSSAALEQLESTLNAH